jgi:hypothetical protein
MMKVNTSFLLLVVSATIQSSPLFQILNYINDGSSVNLKEDVALSQRYLLTPINKVGKPGDKLLNDPRSRLSNGLTRVCSTWVVRTASTIWLPVRIESLDVDDISRKTVESYFYPEAGTPPVDLMNQCERKGRAIYEQVLRTRATDKQYASLKTKYDTKLDGVYETNPLTWKKQGLEWQTPFQVQRVATRNINKEAAIYKNEFNITIGVVIGNENYSVNDENREKLPWSEIVYQVYLDLAKKEMRGPRSLKYVVQQNIVNSETLYIMQQAIARKENKSLVEGKWFDSKNAQVQGNFAKLNPDKLQFPGSRDTFFQIRYATHERLFLALLGTDHGNGIGYLLADHGVAMDKKRIARWVIHERNLIGEYE